MPAKTRFDGLAGLRNARKSAPGRLGSGVFRIVFVANESGRKVEEPPRHVARKFRKFHVRPVFFFIA
jgi:hypothetical protein